MQMKLVSYEMELLAIEDNANEDNANEDNANEG